jgi:hypothetical protein
VPYNPDCVSPQELAEGTLVLLADRREPPAGSPAQPCRVYYGDPILTEADSIYTLETDDQAIYLQPGASQDIAVLVRERGGPPRQSVTIYLWEYQFVVYPASPDRRAGSLLTRVGPGTPLLHRICFDRKVTFPAGQTTPKTIPLKALESGSLTLAFTFDGKPPGDDFPNGGAFYMGVRVMPDDDYSDIPEANPPSWDFMYKTVFRYYHMLYPAMSKIIPFNNRCAMEAAACEIVKRTDPDLWHSTRYMPTTRDLSAGKRQLIVDWAGSLKPPSPPPRPPTGGNPPPGGP